MKIKIVQQNIDSFHRKNNSKYITELMDRLLKEKPHILLLSEFCYDYHKEGIIDRLKNENYEIIYPNGYRIIDDKNLILNGKYFIADDEEMLKKLSKDRNLLKELLMDCESFSKSRKRTLDEKELIVKILKKKSLRSDDKKTLENLLEKIPKHNTFTTVSIIAVKKGVLVFRRGKRKELAENDLRYITGIMKTTEEKGKTDEEIKMFFAHIPHTLVSDEDIEQAISNGGVKKLLLRLEEREEYKVQTLFAAYCFYVENRDEYSFLGGDFNSDENGNTSFLSIFKKLYYAAEDTERKKEKTYKSFKGWEKRFDYALASKPLVCDCKCKTKIIDTISECGTDHKALLTTITL